MDDGTVQIRRYPNRRFYARSESRYVSLQDIEQMIQQGKKVEIRDSQTDENVTRAVLTQMILRQKPEKMALFPIDMLHFILRSNELMSGFLRDYFRQSLAYLEYLQSQGGERPALKPPLHWMRALWQGMLPERPGESVAEASPFEAAGSPLAPAAPAMNHGPGMASHPTAEARPSSATSRLAPEPDPSAPSVAEMQRRMAELEARIRQLEAQGSDGSGGPTLQVRPTSQSSP